MRKFFLLLSFLISTTNFTFSHERREIIQLKNGSNIKGEIVSITRGVGVSRAKVFESLKIGTEDVSVFFVVTRIEDVRDFMQTITEEFELCVPGKGKGFTIDIDGYLGAKAVFVD